MGDKDEPRLTKYVLKNITNRDVHIGDLGYPIPARQSRDLLSRTARLDYDRIMKSRKDGSIAKRLGKSLVEVDDIVVIRPPLKTVAEPTIIQFPQKLKSYIVVDVNEIFEETQVQVLNEEEEILKKLEQNYEEASVPLVAKSENEKDKKTET